MGKLMISDDGGFTWSHRCDFPFIHARPFVSGNELYVLGHCQDLMIIRSDNDGDSWTEPTTLSSGEQWHQAPCNVLESNGSVYLVMEKYKDGILKGWTRQICPVLMKGKIGFDLTQRDNWTFSSTGTLLDFVSIEQTNYFGVPFYNSSPDRMEEVAPGKHCAPIGWLETNVVQFKDLNHYWYDPAGKTFHLWSRAQTGGTGYAAIAKVVEKEDGSMELMLEQAPSGKQMVFVPCPGGQMKFHILYDNISETFWLLSSQTTDSMTKAERLPAGRYGLPNNERHRLQLHFSKNCIDWCFAGIVDIGETYNHSRHYASMTIDGKDLQILSRSGDEHAKNAHDVNLITLHTVAEFRCLLY